MRLRPASGYGAALLLLATLGGLVSHGYNVFRYPLYLTDEGIYTEQAWAVVNQAALSPYTYFYDHAPGGWLLISLWDLLLPGHSLTFGNGINTGRVLMVIIHVASVVMLFQITRKISGSYLAAFVAGLLFDLSPLAVYYQRQVLLDNIMVFWLLLCIYLLVMRRNRVLSTAVAGLSLGLALVTKENAIFLLPGLGYLVYRSVHGRFNRRFAASFWAFAAFVPVGVYVMYAVLKNELWPTAWNFSLSSPPTDHVSLMYTVWWQLNRSQQGLFSNMLNNTWMPRDGVLLIIGALAVLLNLYLGWRRRQENPALFAIALLAAGYAFYLIRGSVVLEFYVLPIIPLLAMNIGIAAAHLTRPLNNPFKVATVATCAILLFSPIGGYFLVYNDKGQVAVHDLYSLSHTDLQQDQVAFLRQNVPYNARIIMDDDIWTFLHEERPFYPFAHSHWKAASDPAVRDTLFQRDWRNIDYIVMSNKMRAAMQGNNAGNQEGWIIDAADNHSQLIWQASRGDVHLMIYQINKQGASGQ